MAHIKAAFLLNIARFTHWSEGAFSGGNTPIRLCLLRENSLGDALETIRGKGVGKRKLEIQVVAGDDPGCHILFIPQGEMARFDREGAALKRANLLTVGDHTDSAASRHEHSGEVVALIREETRIAFEIDLAAARAAQVELSSELLKLGRVVRGDR